MCDVDSNIDINNDASSLSTDTHKKCNRDELGMSEDWIDDMAVPTAYVQDMSLVVIFHNHWLYLDQF